MRLGVDGLLEGLKQHRVEAGPLSRCCTYILYLILLDEGVDVKFQ